MGTLLKSKNSKYWFLVGATLMLLQFVSCKKGSPIFNSNTFLKTYETDSQAKGGTLELMPDGGFTILVDEGSGRPVIIRTDKYGNPVWKKTIQKYSGVFSSQNTIWNAFNTIDPAHFVYQFNGSFTLMDTLGKVDNYAYLPSATTSFGEMIQQGSDYIVPSCNGEYLGGAPTNKIYTFDNNLNLKRTDSIPDAWLGGHTEYLFVNYALSQGNYIISGQKFPRNVWQYGNPIKVFAAKVLSSGKVQQTIIDSGDSRHSDGILWTTNTSDSGLIMLCYRQDYGTTYYHPMVIKIDKNLDTVWVKEYPSGSNNSVLSNLTFCSDGGYIMTGQISNTAFQNGQPYAIRIDKNGNELWTKSFSFSGTSSLWSATELSDGHLAFIGYSNGFGNEILGTRILFIKTDSNGNL